MVWCLFVCVSVVFATAACCTQLLHSMHLRTASYPACGTMVQTANLRGAACVLLAYAPHAGISVAEQFAATYTVVVV